MAGRGRGRGRGKRAQVEQAVPSPGSSATQTLTEREHPRPGAQASGGQQLHLRLQRLPDEFEQLNVQPPRMTRHESGVDLTESDEVLRENEGEPLYLAEKSIQRGRLGERIQLTSNMYELKLPRNTPLYRYELEITECRGNRQRDITKGAKTDTFYVEKRDTCYHIFLKLFELPECHQYLGDNFFAFVYDRSRILYSLVELDLPDAGKTFTLPVALFEKARERLGIDSRVAGYIVKIKAATQDFSMVIDDFSAAIDPDLNKRDRAVVQMLELATTQIIQLNDKHIIYGNKAYGLDRADPIGGGKYLGHGFKKNIRIVEGTKNNTGPIAVQQVDSKKAAFWVKQPVLQTVMQIMNYRNENELNRPLTKRDLQRLHEKFEKGLVFIADKTQHKFESMGMSRERTTDIELNVDGEVMSLANFYERKYDIKLRFQTLPCLMERRPGKEPAYHPMELCTVADNQRVEMMKQTEDLMQHMIKSSALLPVDRRNEIEKEMEKAQLKSNDFLKSLAMETVSKPLDVTGRVLPKPQAAYAGKNGKEELCQPRRDNAKWNSDRVGFIKAAKCTNWVFVVFTDSANRNPRPLRDDHLVAFRDRFIRECRDRGIDIGAPYDEVKITEEPPSAVKSFLYRWQEANVDFILFITGDKSDMHDQMKLYERDFGIVTQHIKAFTVAKKVLEKNDRTVMYNFVAKTNLKLGGQNYKVLLLDPNLPPKVKQVLYRPGRLFVGYDVNHPPPLTREQRRRGELPKEPSVVGLSVTDCSNMEYCQSIGYQQARQEKVITILKNMMADQFATYHRKRMGVSPTELIIFRDGVSEGQLKMLLEVELPQFREAFQEVFGPGAKLKITLFTVEKRHNTRIFKAQINPRDKAPFQNVPSGTVVDDTIVHPTTDEFYLASHTTIQGTAKVPRYETIIDEIGFSSDEKQMIVMALSYNHQIVNSPISMPSVAYDAHELAKRGKNNFRALQDREGSTSGFSSASGYSATSDVVDISADMLKIEGVYREKKFNA